MIVIGLKYHETTPHKHFVQDEHNKGIAVGAFFVCFIKHRKVFKDL